VYYRHCIRQEALQSIVFLVCSFVRWCVCSFINSRPATGCSGKQMHGRWECSSIVHARLRWHPTSAFFSYYCYYYCYYCGWHTAFIAYAGCVDILRSTVTTELPSLQAWRNVYALASMSSRHKSGRASHTMVGRSVTD